MRSGFFGLIDELYSFFPPFSIFTLKIIPGGVTLVFEFLLVFPGPSLFSPMFFVVSQTYTSTLFLLLGSFESLDPFVIRMFTNLFNDPPSCFFPDVDLSP